MSESKSTSNGIGFTGLLLIAFIVLKLCKVINWSWWWVVSPFWIPLSLVGVTLIPYSIYIYRSKIVMERKIKQVMQTTGKNELAAKQQLGYAPKSKWQERLEELQKHQKNN
jgi:hypothetical protein